MANKHKTIQEARNAFFREDVLTLTPPFPGSTDSNCPICIESLVPPSNQPDKPVEEVIQTKLCSHIFHQTCLSEWLQDRTTCPICRRKLYTRPTHLITSNVIAEELTRIIELTSDFLRRGDAINASELLDELDALERADLERYSLTEGGNSMNVVTYREIYQLNDLLDEWERWLDEEDASGEDGGDSRA